MTLSNSLCSADSRLQCVAHSVSKYLLFSLFVLMDGLSDWLWTPVLE